MDLYILGSFVGLQVTIVQTGILALLVRTGRISESTSETIDVISAIVAIVSFITMNLGMIIYVLWRRDKPRV
jgi:putative flippase GtrA